MLLNDCINYYYRKYNLHGCNAWFQKKGVIGFFFPFQVSFILAIIVSFILALKDIICGFLERI